jgi:hypothetical protein
MEHGWNMDGIDFFLFFATEYGIKLSEITAVAQFYGYQIVRIVPSCFKSTE